MATPLLDKVLEQRTEITERHIPKSRLVEMVRKYKVAIAQLETIEIFLKSELANLEKGHPVPKKLTKREQDMIEYENYFNSKYKRK